MKSEKHLPWIMGLCVIAVIGLITWGLYESFEKHPLPSAKLVGVARVMMHEPGKYTIFSTIPESDKYEERYFDLHGEKAEISHEVPPSQKAWAQVESYRMMGDTYYFNLKIHLHSIEEVEGGNWDHGKFGKGETTVVK